MKARKAKIGRPPKAWRTKTIRVPKDRALLALIDELVRKYETLHQ